MQTNDTYSKIDIQPLLNDVNEVVKKGVNKLLYDFSRFIGKDFVLPPDYKKLPDSVLNDKRLIEDSKRYPNSSRSQYYNPNSRSNSRSNYNNNNNNYNNMKYSRRRGGKKSNKKSRKNKDKTPYDFSS